MITTQAKSSEFAGVRGAALVMFVALLAASLHAASISEPATLFYGKVFSTGGGQPFLVTEGQLTWIVRRADGNNLVLRTQLKPLNNGQYSYRLEVPHEALALGLQGTTAGVPLTGADQTHTHLMIAVNGQTARLMGPNGATFDAAQARRTATYRLDLLVGFGAGDIDGNGLPDWWESRHGINDPNADGDGDGWNNRAEFRNGSNPNHDDRVPSLATKEIRAYADGTTLVLLRAIDSDSQPSNLVYTITKTPELGALSLRNGVTGQGSADAALSEGGTFSQADVNGGRVIFAHTGSDVFDTSFGLTLHDETPAHAISTNIVFVNFYKPGRAVAASDLMEPSLAVPVRGPNVAGFVPDEQQFVMSYLLSRDLAYVVGDGSSEIGSVNIAAPSSGLSASQYTNQYVPGRGRDRHHVFLGGLGNDSLVGSMEGDVFIGGPGDDSLRGNGGPDLFLLIGRADGNDTIEDFNSGEGDRIDLSRALVGNSPWLSNYVQLVTSAGNSSLHINSGGTGAPFSNMVLALAGVQLTQSDLVNLVESGHIVSGDKTFMPRVSIMVTAPAASENGPISGEFTLTRSGSTQDPMTVNLQITGSAGNGTDYRYVPPQVTFLAGQRSLILQITPYADAAAELSEIVDVEVMSGAGYAATTASRAQITIEDLMPLVTIEALEPVAVKSDLTPGYFLITRGGILDRSVFVRLTIAGTAANGSDYQSIPAFVNLAPFQTTALIEVTPKATATLSNGVEYVQLSIKPDAAYKTGQPSVARVVIVEEQMTFGMWRDRYFSGSADDLPVFGHQDAGQRGIRNLHRYAFGLNPASPQASQGAPEFKVRDNRLTVAFRRPASVTQVQYVVEVSDDLVTWHSGDQWWEEYAAPEYANQLETVCYRSRQAVSDTPKLFMRVRVVYSP